MKKIQNIIILIISSIFIISCIDDPQQIPSPEFVYDDGVLIANEGPFGSGTGTVTYYKRGGSVLKQNIFQEANTFIPLGNIVQSLTVIGNQVYVMVNNADRVEIMDHRSFVSLESIENVSMPRFMIEVDTVKAYISSWDGMVKVLNTVTNEIEDEIETRPGQERMLKVGGEAWILNQGGMSVDSTITIIDTQTDDVVETLNVYPLPSGICEDKNGLIWIMCSGRLDYHPGGASEGHLIAINKISRTIDRDIAFPNSQNHPFYLQVNADRDVLYYIYPGGINHNINLISNHGK